MISDDENHESKKDPIQFAVKPGIAIDFLSSFSFKHTGQNILTNKIIVRNHYSFNFDERKFWGEKMINIVCMSCMPTTSGTQYESLWFSG